MRRPKHQHFIPKSYLKNFAICKGEKQFVEAKLRNEDEPKQGLISINDICVNKNIYTIPNKDEDKKYALEDYYAREIDAIYPDVYNLLVNPEITEIDANQRGKIIKTTMNLFFRTPKFLNSNQRTTNHILDYAIRNFKDMNGNVKFEFKGTKLNFNVKDVDDVRLGLKIDNKVKFLKDHLNDWHQFINFKLYSAISVYHIYDDIDLITSDNPVIMHSIKGNSFNVFDPSNMISLPLDNKHYLSIFPNTEEAMLNTIYRTQRDKWFALSTNLQVEKNCEEWIMGKPNSIFAHISDKAKYNEETPENLQAVLDMKQRAEDGMELAKTMELYGFNHQNVADKVKDMLKLKIHKDDLEILKISIELAKRGFAI